MAGARMRPRVPRGCAADGAENERGDLGWFVSAVPGRSTTPSLGEAAALGAVVHPDPSNEAEYRIPQAWRV